MVGSTLMVAQWFEEQTYKSENKAETAENKGESGWGGLEFSNQ